MYQEDSAELLLKFCLRSEKIKETTQYTHTWVGLGLSLLIRDTIKCMHVVSLYCKKEKLYVTNLKNDNCVASYS